MIYKTIITYQSSYVHYYFIKNDLKTTFFKILSYIVCTHKTLPSLFLNKSPVKTELLLYFIMFIIELKTKNVHVH